LHVVASNSLVWWPPRNQPIFVPVLSVPGDLDGDGIVDQSELNARAGKLLAEQPVAGHDQHGGFEFEQRALRPYQHQQLEFQRVGLN